MEATVYYFSGTGNSLSIARKIAEKLKCVYKSINYIDNFQYSELNQKIILVFPVYLAQGFGLPIIVKEKIESLKKYNSEIIGICTCGGLKLVNAIPTLLQLKKIVESNNIGTFDGYSIKMPMNNLDYPSPLINQNQEKMFRNADIEINIIVKNIIKDNRSIKFIFQLFFSILMKPLYILLKKVYENHVFKMAKLDKNGNFSYFEAIRLTDRSIEINQSCNGCRICEKICPVNNIIVMDGKPTFLHHCEMCTACDEWCPQNAIHHWCRKKNVKYHHPTIKINEMLSNHPTTALT